LTFPRSFPASTKESTKKPSQKSKKKTVSQLYVDEFAPKKNNARKAV
jgi:hypothetical protein